MMGLPAKWWLLGGGLLLTLWLVWQAPPAPDKQTKVIAAVQPITKSVSGKVDTPDTPNPSSVLLDRQPSEMVSDLFRTPPSPVLSTVKLPETTVSSTKKTLPAIPFRYIGSMEKAASVTVFIMEGEALHLLQTGDSPRADYRLEAIDLAAGELRWRYLPDQQIRNMSIKP